MSGVGITGKIVPQNGGNFPVFEDINGQGGLRTVADIATRDGLITSHALFLKEGMLVYVQSTKCYYALLSNLASWIIVANNGLGSQATWFIDPVNGNDANDGVTLATALKTEPEFRARCFPNGQKLLINQNVTVTFVGNTAQTIAIGYFNVGNGQNPLLTVPTFTVVAQITSTSDITLTNVITPVPNVTRGEIVTASGVFVSKERIRVTSGAAIGAESYSMGLNGGATDTFVSNFALSAATRVLWPTIGDKVQVDTLLFLMGRCEIVASPDVRVVIQDFKITRAFVSGTSGETPFTGGGGNVTFLGCQAFGSDSTWTTTVGAVLVNCRIPPTGKIAFLGPEWLFINFTVQGVCSILGSGNSYGIAIDGGCLIIGDNGDFNHPGDGASATLQLFGNTGPGNVSYGALQAENGPSPGGSANTGAINIYNGSLRNDGFHAEMWGLSGGYTYGVTFYGTGILLFPTPTNLLTQLAIASVTNLLVAGIKFAYSKNPTFIANQNCGIILGQVDGIDLVTDNYIYLTAQTAAKGVTNLLTGQLAGAFRFWGYIAPTNVGAAGNLTLNAIFTDDSGVQQTKAVCSIDNTILAGSGASLEIESAAGSSISYSITGFTAGLVYTARIGIEIDSKGP